MLEPNCVAIWLPTGWVQQGQIHGLQQFGCASIFGLVLGVAVLIMRTAEFEPDEIVAGDVFHLRLTSTVVAERTSKRPRPIAGPVVAIRFRILLPEMNIRLLDRESSSSRSHA